VLPQLLEKIARAKVLVVGDAMLDRYWYGDVERISPEAPVPVVAVKEEKDLPGGAANVARSVRALGAGCTLFAISGTIATRTASSGSWARRIFAAGSSGTSC
jgi:bifunctional ADP-heptose synthase (sugar kinase/adenylyltransferase)